jgi:hypothetical protein
METKVQKLIQILPKAVGEVLLIVTGILIAQGLSNWNTNRVSRNEETKMLFDLKAELAVDTSSINNHIFGLAENVQYSERLLKLIEQKVDYNDSLANYFSMGTQLYIFAESKSAYQTLLARGLDRISNDKIRNCIVSIYNGAYETLKLCSTGVYLKYADANNFYLEHFDKVGSEYIDSTGNFVFVGMKPHDFKALTSNKKYLTILSTTIQQKRVMQYVLENTKKEAKELIALIANEVENR